MRFLFASIALVTLAGCSTQTEEVGAQSDDVVASVWTQDEAASTLSIHVGGTGDVPQGSGCMPGESWFNLNPKTKSIYIAECVGSPARVRGRNARPTDAEWAAVVGAARSVTTSDKTTCETEAKLPWVTMGVYPATTGAFPSQYVVSDCFGCEGATWKKAAGVDNVVDLLAQLAAATPLPPISVFTGTLPTPATVWSETMDANVTLSVAGAGSLPAGSACAPGGKQSTLLVHDGRWTLTSSACAPVSDDADSRLMLKGRTVVLTEAEAAKVRQTLTRMTVAGSATCALDKPYVTAAISGADAAGTPGTTRYVSRENACILGIDYGPYLDLNALRTVVDEIVAAH